MTLAITVLDLKLWTVCYFRTLGSIILPPVGDEYFFDNILEFYSSTIQGAE